MVKANRGKNRRQETKEGDKGGCGDGDGGCCCCCCTCGISGNEGGGGGGECFVQLG